MDRNQYREEKMKKGSSGKKWLRLKAAAFAMLLAALTALSGCAETAPSSSAESEAELSSSTSNSEYKSVGVDGNKFLSQKLRSFSKIDVDIDVGEVKVQTGQYYEVYREWGKVDYYISVKIGSDSVTVKSSGQLPGPDDGSNPEVIVTVPEDAVMEEITIRTGSGDVSLEEILVSQADCRTEDGDVLIEAAGDGTEWNYELSAEAGKVVVDGVESGASASSQNGGKYTVKAESGNGNITFASPEE